MLESGVSFPTVDFNKVFNLRKVSPAENAWCSRFHVRVWSISLNVSDWNGRRNTLIKSTRKPHPDCHCDTGADRLAFHYCVSAFISVISTSSASLALLNSDANILAGQWTFSPSLWGSPRVWKKRTSKVVFHLLFIEHHIRTVVYGAPSSLCNAYFEYLDGFLFWLLPNCYIESISDPRFIVEREALQLHLLLRDPWKPPKVHFCETVQFFSCRVWVKTMIDPPLSTGITGGSSVRNKHIACWIVDLGDGNVATRKSILVLDSHIPTEDNHLVLESEQSKTPKWRAGMPSIKSNEEVVVHPSGEFLDGATRNFFRGVGTLFFCCYCSYNAYIEYELPAKSHFS